MGIDCRWPEVDGTYDGWSVVERSRLSVYFAVFSVAVMEKCCDACRYGNTISGRFFWRQRVPEFKGIDCRWPEVDGTYDGWSVVERSRLSVYFAVFSVAVMEKCCDACRDGEYYFRSGFSVSKGAGVWEASIAVDRKSMGHTVADRSSNEADFLCILLYLAWRLWKSVVTLAVTGNTISGRVFRRQRVPEFMGIDCRWPEVDGTYDGWSVVERSRLSVYFAVFSVAVMEKCCDACRDGEYYFRSGFLASEGAGV
jgi:hypothetical protein